MEHFRCSIQWQWQQIKQPMTRQSMDWNRSTKLWNPIEYFKNSCNLKFHYFLIKLVWSIFNSVNSSVNTPPPFLFYKIALTPEARGILKYKYKDNFLFCFAKTVLDYTYKWRSSVVMTYSNRTYRQKDL